MERLAFCEEQGKLVALLAPQVCAEPAPAITIIWPLTCALGTFRKPMVVLPPLQVAPADLAAATPDFAAMLAAVAPGCGVTGLVACCQGGDASLCLGVHGLRRHLHSHLGHASQSRTSIHCPACSRNVCPVVADGARFIVVAEAGTASARSGNAYDVVSRVFIPWQVKQSRVFDLVAAYCVEAVFGHSIICPCHECCM